MDESALETRRISCNACGGQETNHRLIFRYNLSSQLYHDGNLIIDEAPESWELWQCMGCGNITLRVVKEAPWDDEPYVMYFPERNIDFEGRLLKKSFYDMPDSLNHLYGEVISAYNNGLALLCAAGIRALLEGICEYQGIEGGEIAKGRFSRSLAGKIEGLSALLPEHIVHNLHSIRFLGNSALHDLDAPTEEDLLLAISVIEDILNLLYNLNYKSTLLHQRISLRGKNANKRQDSA